MQATAAAAAVQQMTVLRAAELLAKAIMAELPRVRLAAAVVVGLL
jgi:hypothetical protein